MIKTTTEYSEFQDWISFHSATDTLIDFKTIVNEHERATLYIVSTK